MSDEQFKKTFIPYHPKLYRIAYRLLEDKALAEDTVQEVYIKLWERRSEIENIENTEAFAVVILKNTCLDIIRKTKRINLNCEYEANMAEEKSLIRMVELKDELNYVEQLVEKLPVMHCQIMKLKHWGDYSDEEIEEMTGVNTGNIRVILSRARKRIREQFKMWNENGNR